MVKTTRLTVWTGICTCRETGGESEIIYVYKDISIKSAERMQRGSGEGVAFASIVPSHRLKQWMCLVLCDSSKPKLFQFMMEDRKRPHLKEKLEGKVLCDMWG